jgi:hypothetical protein
MNCQVCGSLAGEGSCAECRALALEISANAEALGELRYDELPPLTVRIPRRRPVYPWLAAVAAAILLGLALPHFLRRPPAEAPPPVPTETLTIKMLTPDPTVVIYWLADTKADTKEEKR